MKKLFRRFRRKFTKDLESPLTFTPEDFERGKKWAKAQDAIDGSNRSLWDQINGPRQDTIATIAFINKMAGLD